MGSKHAVPGEQKTKMIEAKLPRDDVPEKEWPRMNEEIEECKTLAWKVKPLSKRRILRDWKWQDTVLNQEGPGRETPT